MREQPVSILDRAFAALGRNIHVQPLRRTRTERGNAGDRVCGRQHEIDAARKQRAIAARRAAIVRRQRRSAERCPAADAGAFAVRVWFRAPRIRPEARWWWSGRDTRRCRGSKASNGGRFSMSHANAKAASLWIVDERAAAVKAKPLPDLVMAAQSAVEPDRRVVIAERQRNRRGAGGQRRGRVNGFAKRLHRAGACERIENRAERRLRLKDRFGESLSRSWSVLAANQREKFDLGGGSLLRGLRPLAQSGGRAIGASTLLSSTGCHCSRCSRASTSAIKPRLLVVAPERIAEAGFAGRKPDGAARTVASPKLNGAPSPPMRPRSITSPLCGARSSRMRRKSDRAPQDAA